MKSFCSSSIFVLAASGFLAYAVGLVVYRLYFHPLAKFPGPKLAAATRLYEAYYDVVLGGRYTHKIGELHAKYGPIIRISPHELHIHDPDYYDRFYREDGRRHKYAWSYEALGSTTTTICTPDPTLHKMRRSALAPLFSKSAVNAQMDFIIASINRLAERIDGFVASGEVLNLGAAFSAMTNDVATVFTLGKHFHTLDQEDFNATKTAAVRFAGYIWRLTKHIRYLGPMLKSLPMSVLGHIGSEQAQGFMLFHEIVCREVDGLMKRHISGQRFLSSSQTAVDAILSSKNILESDKCLTRISDEVISVTGAGFETTASALRMISYHLYTNPHILARLRGELRSLSESLGPGVTPTLAQLNQLPTLTGVIWEGLRLSPGLATRMARISDEDIRYAEWIIPPHTPVGMTTILMHYDETIYENPKLFNPDRFADQESRWRLEKYFGPFSRGSRNCLGINLAWAELYLALALLVPRFDFDFVSTRPDDVEFYSDQFVLGMKSDHGIRVTARHHQAHVLDVQTSYKG